MPTFTDDQIQSLAPDAASLNAGKALANAQKWPTLAYNDRVLWGEVPGSGKDPYRTQADLTDLAFKCSCPSRKFPCKHGLGLLLLYAREPGRFTSPAEPAWVSEWMDKRTEKAAQLVAQSPATGTTTETDRNAKSRQKRTTDRLDSVRAGVAELDRWLQDLVRTGLLTLPEKEASFWQNTAARLVDAKAPGLAYRVKQLGSLAYFDGNAWQSNALRQFGQLYLLTRAFDRLDGLPPDLRADVEAAVGLTINQKDLLESSTAETLTDTFWVLARQTTTEEDLTVQRSFLYGFRSGRFALILNFAYKNGPIQTLLVPGTQTDATLVFYPGRWPYRAVLKNNETRSRPAPTQTPVGLADWSAAQQALTDVLSRSPWADEVPQIVSGLSVAGAGDRHYLRDANGLSQPLDPGWPAESFFHYLALTGGRAATVALLQSETHILPLGVWVDDGYYCL